MLCNWYGIVAHEITVKSNLIISKSWRTQLCQPFMVFIHLFVIFCAGKQAATRHSVYAVLFLCDRYTNLPSAKMLPGIAHSSLVHYFDMLRKVIINSSDNTKMGGQVDGFQNVIEIDESLFGKKQKYVRGRTTEKQWVFGLVERGTRKNVLQMCIRQDKTDLTAHNRK